MAGEQLGDQGADELPRRGATMRDVAEHAGTSLSAVSLSLSGKAGVSPERRRRIAEAVDTLGYRPRRTASNQPRTRASVIGLVMEALSPAAAHDGFMAEVVSGVEDGLRRRGMRMALQLYRPGDAPRDDVRALTGRDPDGLILANGGDVDESLIRTVLAGGLPVVLLENYLESEHETHAVVADNFTAGLRCTRHLLQSGHRRVGMLVGSTRYISLTDRRRGYQAALLEAGITPHPELMPAQERGQTRKGYRQMVQLLELAEPPTAVYAVSDQSAAGAYQAIADRGLRIPEDISLIGTDDAQSNTLLRPQLTTFQIPTFELGRTAARTIASLLDHEPIAPARTALLGRLVERASVRSLR